MMEAYLKALIARSMVNRLVEIKTYLENRRESYLSIESLSDINLQLAQLDLCGDIDFERRFCQPVPANDFEELYKSSANKEHSCLKQLYKSSANEEHRCLKQRKVPGLMNRFDQALSTLDFLEYAVAGIEHQGDLYGKYHWAIRSTYDKYRLLSSTDYKDPSQQRWEMSFIRHALPLPRRHAKTVRPFAAGEVTDSPRPGPAHPHIMFSVANSCPADDQKLFRAEILAAVSIMATHGRQKPIWRNYHTHPVFVYSFTGPHARVLQIHFDVMSDTLCVRISPFMMIDCCTPEEEWREKDRWRENEENIKLILRWMAGTPVGDTSYKSLNLGQDDDARWGEQPRTPSKRSLKVAG